MTTKIKNPGVAKKFREYPPEYRKKLLHFRGIILKTSKDAQIGNLIETLKWGEPSYLPAVKTGTTIRISWLKSKPEQSECTSIAKQT